MNLPPADLALEPAEPTPRRRSRRVLAGTAALATIAVVALTVARGEGTTNATTDGDLALAGIHAPSEGAAGKSVGRPASGEKVVGGVAAKGSSTTGAPGSTTTGSPLARSTGATTGGLAASRAGTGAIASTVPGSAPTTTAAPARGNAGAPTTAAPTTAAPTTAPPAAPPTTARPSGGGIGFTPAGPVYWLATNGNDASNGTEGAPWRTFAAALGRLRAGDTLYVKAGTYGSTSAGAAIDVSGVNGATGAPITLAAAPGQQVNLLGGGWQVVRVGNSSYIDIRNFDVSGSAATDRSESNGIEVDDSHHVRIIGNTVHDVGGGGISANRANHVTIDSNRVYNTSFWNPYQTSAISLFESSNIGGGNNSDGFSFYIRNNVAWNNKNLVGVVSDGNCIIVDSNRHTGYTGATYVSNNLCYANGGRGVHVFMADNVLAANNTLVGNLTSSQMFDSGELSANEAMNVRFRNNLVIPGRDGNGTMEYLASTITYANNLFVGRAPTHHGSSDRIVIDAHLGSDYVPMAGSAAIDGGTTDGAPPTDRRGRARVGAPDIGCYEA